MDLKTLNYIKVKRRLRVLFLAIMATPLCSVFAYPALDKNLLGHSMYAQNWMQASNNSKSPKSGNFGTDGYFDDSYNIFTVQTNMFVTSLRGANFKIRNGNVTYKAKQGSVKFDTPANASSVVDVYNPRPIFPNLSGITFRGGANIVNRSRVYEPGHYNKLEPDWTVSIGNPIKLRAGEYFFNDIDILAQRGVRIIPDVNGDFTTVINIKNTLKLGSHSKIMTSTPDGHGKVLILYRGNTKISLVSNSSIVGALIAPNALIEFNNAAKLIGQALARTIRMIGFNGGDGLEFIPFNPAAVKLAGAASFVLNENTEVTNVNKTNNSRLFKIPIQLSAATAEIASLKYEVRPAGTKWASGKTSALFGSDTNGNDICMGATCPLAASSSTGTLDFIVNATEPTNGLYLWINDDNLIESGVGGKEYIELKLYDAVKLKFESDVDAVYAGNDSLIYLIPVISDDPANQSPVVLGSLPDTIFTEDLGNFKLDTTGVQFSDPDGNPLTISVTSSKTSLITANASLVSNQISLTTVTDQFDTTTGSTITVTATDQGGLSVNTSFVVRLREVNDAPEMGKVAATLTIAEDAVIDTNFFNVVKYGPSNEGTQAVQGYKVISVSDASLFMTGPSITTAGALQFTLAANVVNTSWIRVRLQDNGGTDRSGIDTSTIDSILISVTSVNDTPTVDNPIEDINLLEDFKDTLIIADLNNVFSDFDGDNLTFTVTVNNKVNYYSPSLGNDSLILRPIQDEFGSSGLVVVQASDGSLSVLDSFKINILSVNDAPKFTAGSNINKPEEADFNESWASAVSSGPANEIAQTLLFEISNISDSSLFSGLPAIDPNGALSFKGALNQTGTATVSYRLKDNGLVANGGVDTTNTQTFDITLTNTNDNPVVDNPIADTLVLEDFAAKDYILDLNTVFSDPDGNTMSFSINRLNELSASSVIGNLLSLNSKVDSNGVDSIVVNASDGMGGIAKDTFVVTIKAVNDAPNAVSKTVVLMESQADSAVTINFNDYLTINNLGPANESSQTLSSIKVTLLSAGNQFVGSPVTDPNYNLSLMLDGRKNGIDTFQVIIEDSGDELDGGVNKDTVLLMINVDPSPSTLVITGGLTFIDVLEDFSGILLSDTNGLNVDDPDGASLVLTVESVEGIITAKYDSNTDSIYIAPVKDKNGRDSIKLTLIDSVGDRKTVAYYPINVIAVNDAPGYTKGANITESEEVEYSEIWATSLSKGPSDESTQNLRFTVDSIKNPGLFLTAPTLSTSGVLSFEGAKDSVGTSVLYFQLRDDGGTINNGIDSTGVDSLIIELNNVNDVPVLKNTIPNIAVVEDSGFVFISHFDSIFSDPDGDALTYTVVLANGKAINSSNVDSLSLFTSPDSNGMVTVTLTATDPAGLSVTTQFDFNIIPVNDGPTAVTLSANNVLENSPQGTEIGNFGTVDIDLNDAFIYELTDDSVYTSNAFVQINGNKLEVKLTDSIDYETRKNFQIKVRSYDSDSAFVDSVFTINISNVNDAPYRLGEIKDIVLDEDFNDSLVITQLDTLFIDPEGDKLVYTITALTNKVIDTISTDSITLRSILNEFGVDTLIITAEDIVGNKVYDTVLVTVNSVNDEMIVNDTTGSVIENVNDDLIIGVVKVIDVDGDSITFEINPFDTNYVIDDKGNIRLKDGVTLDFENSPLDTIQVIVGDGTTKDTVSVVITVINEVEKSKVEVIQVKTDKKTWTTELDTVWINSASVTISYNEDGNLGDSLVVIKTSIKTQKSGVQEVIRIFHNKTKDIADTVITYLIYSTNEPEIGLDTSTVKIPQDSNGVLYLNDASMTVDLIISEYGKDPSILIYQDTTVNGKKTEGVIEPWIIEYTDIYGNKVIDTLYVILDTTAPLVEITRPSDNYVLTNLFAYVDWQVDGVQMIVDTTETLIEGKNLIIRSYADFAGNVGYDTVSVKAVLDGNKVSVTLENEVLSLNKGDEKDFDNRVTSYYEDRGRDKDDVKKESWNLSFQLPDDETDEFTELTGYHEAYYHDGSKKVERELADQEGYILHSQDQIGISLNVEMQFPVLSNEFDTGSKDAKGVCENGDYMWNLFVDQMKIVIYDQMGQFVRSEIIEGFPVGARYQDRGGKVNARFDMPSLKSDIRADDGRRWAAGVYLLHIQIQTRAMGINCNEGEKEISRLGTMKRQGYLRE